MRSNGTTTRWHMPSARRKSRISGNSCCAFCPDSHAGALCDNWVTSRPMGAKLISSLHLSEYDVATSKSPSSRASQAAAAHRLESEASKAAAQAEAAKRRVRAAKNTLKQARKLAKASRKAAKQARKKAKAANSASPDRARKSAAP